MIKLSQKNHCVSKGIIITYEAFTNHSALNIFDYLKRNGDFSNQNHDIGYILQLVNHY
jgi:hypothetical protein